MTFDQLFRLAGDEDTGVGLHCRTCDRGGLPVAFLCSEGAPNPYHHNANVAMVRGIRTLLAVGKAHAVHVHDLRVWVDG